MQIVYQLYEVFFIIYSFGVASIEVLCAANYGGYHQCDGNGVPILVTRLIQTLFHQIKLYKAGYALQTKRFWLYDNDLLDPEMKSFQLIITRIEREVDPNRLRYADSFNEKWVAFVGFFITLQEKPFSLDISNELRSLSKYLN